MSAFEDLKSAHDDSPDVMDFIATLGIVVSLSMVSILLWSRVPFLKRISRMLTHGDNADDKEQINNGPPRVNRMKRD